MGLLSLHGVALTKLVQAEALFDASSFFGLLLKVVNNKVATVWVRYLGEVEWCGVFRVGNLDGLAVRNGNRDLVTCFGRLLRSNGLLNFYSSTLSDGLEKELSGDNHARILNLPTNSRSGNVGEECATLE